MVEACCGNPVVAVLVNDTGLSGKGGIDESAPAGLFVLGASSSNALISRLGYGRLSVLW